MFTIEMDERSSTSNAILENGNVVLYLYNGATVNEDNIGRIVDVLNSNEICTLIERRKYADENNRSIIEYVINGQICTFLDGHRQQKNFVDVCFENSENFRSHATNPEDVCKLCANGIQSIKKCYMGGWDECKGVLFKQHT